MVVEKEKEEAINPEEAAHQRKMAILMYLGGFVVFFACGFVEIFIKPVPPFLYALGLVVAGKHDVIAQIFLKK